MGNYIYIETNKVDNTVSNNNYGFEKHRPGPFADWYTNLLFPFESPKQRSKIIHVFVK